MMIDKGQEAVDVLIQKQQEDRERREAFAAAVKPLMRYLASNRANSTVVVTSTTAKLLDCRMAHVEARADQDELADEGKNESVTHLNRHLL